MPLVDDEIKSVPRVKVFIIFDCMGFSKGGRNRSNPSPSAKSQDCCFKSFITSSVEESVTNDGYWVDIPEGGGSLFESFAQTSGLLSFQMSGFNELKSINKE